MDIFIRMVYTSDKRQACMWWWLILSLIMFPNESRGLSDMKICGDSGCEMMMSRVLATKNFEAPDCRFLSFRKGDVIFVYYKLAGKRDDLWAGSRDRSFGYFPKDAVKIDEIHVSEEKEITLSTEKQDFFCIDEYGGVIEFDDLVEREENQPRSEINSYNKNLHDTLENTNVFEASTQTSIDQTVSEDVPDKVSPGASAQGGSSWIPSAITGWLGTTHQNNAGTDNNHGSFPGNDEKQDTFRKRKLALDEEQLEEKSSMIGWIGGELTNVLGYGQKQAEIDATSTQKTHGERQSAEEKPVEKQMDSSGQFNSWLNIGFGDVLKAVGGQTAEADRAKEPQGQGTDVLPEGEPPRLKHPPHQKQEVKETETVKTTTDIFIATGNEGLLESPEASIEIVQEDDMTKEDSGSILNNIAEYYTGKEKEEHPENGGPLSEIEGSSHTPVEDTTHDRGEAETLLPLLLGNITSETQIGLINYKDEVQQQDNSNLFSPAEEYLVKDYYSSQGEKVSPDIDGNRNQSSLQGTDDSNNQKTPSEEKTLSFLPTESQIKYDKDRNEKSLTVSGSEFEEKADISVQYENQDEISEVPLTENELHQPSNYTADPTTHSDVSDSPLHQSHMSDSTSEKTLDSVQSQFVTAVTDKTEITPNLSTFTQPQELTDTLSDKVVVPDETSFEKDTSAMEMTTSNKIGVHNQALKEDSESDDEKDVVVMNKHEDSDHITITEESKSDTDKELIVNNQHPDSDELKKTAKTDVLNLIQSKDGKETQELDQDAEKEQGERSSSDFPSEVANSHEPKDTTNDQHKYNIESLEARSVGVTTDGTFSVEANQIKAKHDHEAQEESKQLDVTDRSMMENTSVDQQEADNESVTELLNTESKHSDLDTLSAQSNKDMESRSSSTETSLNKVDLSPPESNIYDPDSVILSETETEADCSQTKVVKTLKRDETELETIEISSDSDTHSQSREHDCGLYKFDSSEDNIFSPTETVIEDTPMPDKALGAYMSDKTDKTASVIPLPHSKTVSEEQKTVKTEFEVTEATVTEVQETHLSDSVTDTGTVMNVHIDSVKIGKGNAKNIYTPREQSPEYIQTDPFIKEDKTNTGWYGSVYNSFTGLYGGGIKPDDTGNALDLSDTAKTPAREGILNEEDTVPTQEPQSLFSVDGLSSVFESFTSKTDTASDEGKDQQSEEPPTENSPTDSRCLQGTCTGLTEKAKVTSRDGETAREIQDLIHFKDEDVRYSTTIHADSVSVENSDIREDTTEFHHNPSPIDNYESQNESERPIGDGLKPDPRLTAAEVDVWLTDLELVKYFLKQVVSSLPDDLRPGPDLYGLPWEPVIFTAVLGLLIILLFSCRLYQSVKSRLYARREIKMAQKIEELLEEKCKTLEQLSKLQKEYDKRQTALQNGGLLADIDEKRKLENMSQQLQETNAQMRNDVDRLTEELNTQREKRIQEEQQVADVQETLRSLEEKAQDLKSQMEQATTTLKIHNMNSERLEKRLQVSREENAMLKESTEQLSKEAEGWGERLAELEEEMKMCESSHRRMQEDCANKDERIKSLTECLLKMRDWDSEDEDEANGDSGPTETNGDGTADYHQQQKIQKLIYAAKLNADLRSLEEDKNRVVAKLADEIKAKEDLLEGIEQLEKQKERLQVESATLTSESQKLQQKLTIMTEMYHENELKLHRMLTVEEKERLQKEEKLNKADMKISLAAEEMNSYKTRADELVEELDKTNQAYKNQIASHEKKAHDNWLAARAADRDLADIKRENAHLRQKLTDYQFKLEVLEKDPYALDAPGRPLFRGESTRRLEVCFTNISQCLQSINTELHTSSGKHFFLKPIKTPELD
ncbi:hypothetical protein ACEWY4_005755 [Coilia grayii]|uniref:SH3 domain-containing protein n=1 Tax=Coilia grayii TaxID=363190 RepID=A0ABD1KJH7_9TELE